MKPDATRSASPPGRPARVEARLACAAILVLVAGSLVRADDLNGYVELGRSDSSTQFDTPSGQDERFEASTWTRRANITWTRHLFPNLLIDLGAFYERSDQTLEQSGFEQDSAASRLRPYARLALRSEVYLAEAAWYRTDEKFRTDDLATFELIRDTFIGVFGWYPWRLPSWRFELSHVEDRDATRQSVDATENTLRVNSEYTPVPSTRIYYRGLLEEQSDQVHGSDFQTIAHTGEVRFNDTFFNRIWELYGSWNGGYRQVEVQSGGTGELLIPVVALDGLFDLDDTPDQGVLTPLPALVDQNTLVGTSVNLGLPPPAGDRRERNIGVDLGIVRDVNLIYLWVDRQLPIEVSRSFTWEIWTSADGQFWNRTSTVASAPFGPFDNRFELRFPFANTRYLKVVVLPLAATVPSASTYPTILVTELETFSAQPSGSTPRTVTTTRNLIQANSRVRLLRNTGLWFETNLYGASSSGSPTFWTLSNGLFLQQRFDEVWSVSARVAREDGREQGGSRVAYVYSAIVNSTPLETLRNTLSVSGAEQDTDGVRQSSTGVFLNSSATVYQGVDLNVSVGSSHNALVNAPTTDSIQYHVGTTLVPHRTLTININLDDRDSTYSSQGVPDRQEGTRSVDAGLAFSPVSSIYFFASRLFEQRTNQPDRTFDTFAFSWTPFPAGALRIGLNYSENHNSLYNENDQTFTPTLRWEFNRRSYFQITYENLKIESDIGHSRQETLAGILHIGSKGVAMRASWAIRLVAFAAVLGVAGCTSHRSAEVTYHDPGMDFSLLQKVAVLPFSNLTQTPAAGERVRDVFTTMLQAGGTIYVLPPGEVARGLDRASVAKPTTPTAEECVNLGKILQVDAVITGVVREYGEVRSGTAASNVASVSVQMMETQSGKLVWSASSTQGGITAADRMFGGGGNPMDQVTSEAVRDLLDKLYK